MPKGCPLWRHNVNSAAGAIKHSFYSFMNILTIKKAYQNERLFFQISLFRELVNRMMAQRITCSIFQVAVFFYG